MLHALAHEISTREVWWLFGARNRDDHPFAEESKQLIRSLARGKSCIRYSPARPQDRPGIDFDEPGHIAADMIDKLGVPREADFYLCGPAAFMADLTAGLAALGIPGERLHAEAFGAAKSMTPGITEIRQVPPHSPEGSPGPGPQVSFARSGLNVRWDPKFTSLLEFAEACDVPVRWACRTGVCRTCESGLISGSVTYQPEPLEPPAQGNLFLCCSQPQDNVVLDL
jgi:ferredoxin-NADP reductase